MATMKKRSAAFLLVFLLAIAAFAGLMATRTRSEASATFSGGDGTAANPWRISTAEQLNSVRSYLGTAHNNKHFIMTNNISLANYSNWVPIGTGASANTAFNGHFNGNGFHITNIHCYRLNTDYQGLFGSIFNGTVRNLGIESGDIIGGDRTGGIAGYTNNATISFSYNKAQVGNQLLQVLPPPAPPDPGGIVGVADNQSVITRCYNTGQINGEIVGGLVGTLQGRSQLTNSYNGGHVIGLVVNNAATSNNLAAGGLVGRLIEGTIINSYSYGTVTIRDNRFTHVGGLVGRVDNHARFVNGGGLFYRDSAEHPVGAANYGIPANDVSGRRNNAQLISRSNYPSYDFDNIWYMWDGRHSPLLRGVGGQSHSVSHTVTFLGGGGVRTGGGAEVQQVYFGGNITAPPVYELAGHVFSGWSASLQNITSNRTIIAQWTLSDISVTFDPNGGFRTGGGALTQSVQFGGSAVAPTVERDGHMFVGWDTQFNFITESITVRALWAASQFTVRFHANGGTWTGGGDETQTILFGQTINYPVYARSGFTFVGWERAFNGNILDITAIWGQNPTITFNLAGGVLKGGGNISQNIVYGGTAELPITERTGYDFIGWDRPNQFLTQSVTINALWQIKSYTVTFNANGGVLREGLTTQTVEHGKGALAPVFERLGFEFAGWNVDFSQVTGDLSVTAIWNERFVTVTFNGNGGVLKPGSSSSLTSQTIPYGGTVTAPEFERANFYFVGWDAPLNGITENTSISAVWAADLHTVVFDTNGGVRVGGGETLQHIAHGHAAIEPILERQGYDFAGWDQSFGIVNGNLTVRALWNERFLTVTFEGAGGTVRPDTAHLIQQTNIRYGDPAVAPAFDRVGFTFSHFDRAFDRVTENMTVRAVWNPIMLSLVFDGAGGVSGGLARVTLSVQHGTTPAAPLFTREGYNFIGWDKSFNNLTESTTVTARWTIQTRTVTFDGAGGLSLGGLPVVPVTVNYGSNARAPQFTRAGYEFNGWDKPFNTVIENFTVTARWTYKQPAIGVEVHQDTPASGSKTLKVANLIDGLDYAFQWQKLSGGAWQNIPGANSGYLVIGSNEDSTHYRVIISVIEPDSGTRYEYTTDSNSLTVPGSGGSSGVGGAGGGSNGSVGNSGGSGAGASGAGGANSNLTPSQRSALGLFLIIAIPVLLLIIIFVALGVNKARRRREREEQLYYSNYRWKQ